LAVCVDTGDCVSNWITGKGNMTMKKLSDYKEYDGIDANLAISLYEYGMIWAKRIKDHENDYHFIYGVGMGKNTETGETEYNQFDHADIPINCNLEEEYNWVKWNGVNSFVGYDILETVKNNPDFLPQAIHDLVSYYGYENIFGSSYYPFEIENDD